MIDIHCVSNKVEADFLRPLTYYALSVDSPQILLLFSFPKFARTLLCLHNRQFKLFFSMLPQRTKSKLYILAKSQVHILLQQKRSVYKGNEITDVTMHFYSFLAHMYFPFHGLRNKNFYSRFAKTDFCSLSLRSSLATKSFMSPTDFKPCLF